MQKLVSRKTKSARKNLKFVLRQIKPVRKLVHFSTEFPLYDSFAMERKLTVVVMFVLMLQEGNEDNWTWILT